MFNVQDMRERSTQPVIGAFGRSRRLFRQSLSIDRPLFWALKSENAIVTSFSWTHGDFLYDLNNNLTICIRITGIILAQKGKMFSSWTQHLSTSHVWTKLYNKCILCFLAVYIVTITLTMSTKEKTKASSLSIVIHTSLSATARNFKMEKM